MKTRGKYLLLAGMILTGFILLFTGCKKDKDKVEEEPQPEVIIADNAKFIDQATWQGSYVSVDSTTWTYLFTAGISAMNFKEGDIMVSAAGQGALRKITRITTIGNQVEFQTTGATLTDIFKQARITIDTFLTLSKIKSIRYYYPGIVLDTSRLKHGSETEFNWDINVNLTNYIKLTGNFGCDWEILFDVNIGYFSGLEEVKCGFKSTENLNLTLVAGYEYNLEKSIKLASVSFSPIFIFVGPFIVVISPEFDLNVGVEGYANASVTTSVEQSLSFNAGIHYLAASGWSNYKEFNKSFEFQPPQLNMNAGAVGYLKPELFLKVYGIAGPYANLKLYGKIDANLVESPWWELFGGLKMDAGVKAEVFGKTLFDYNVPDIINYEMLIAAADTNTLIVTTSAVTDITETSARCGGNVIQEGASATTQRGVCWGTDSLPTLSGSHSNDGTGPGEFTSIIEGLTENTPYFVRAYAINLTDTSYGSYVKFTTTVTSGQPCPGLSTVSYEGKVYNTVLIGSQCWLRENLNVGLRIDGNKYQNATNGTIEKYCYDNNENMCDTYGGLYQWDEAMQGSTTPGAKGICPVGWHIPTKEEWIQLADYLGGVYIAGGRMKEAGTVHWMSPNIGASNLSGFTALAGGIGSPVYAPHFDKMLEHGNFWSSTPVPGNIWQMTLTNLQERCYIQGTGSLNGFSVRCLKN